MIPRLSIIIATVGRPTLLNALASLEPQITDADEVLVIPDFPRHGGWGYVAHNKGARLATGSHLIWIGDDDDFLPGGLDIVREGVSRAPNSVHLFSIMQKPGVPTPRGTPADAANFASILTIQGGIVVPRHINMPLWRPENGADKLFAAQAVANSGFPAVWHPPTAIGRWRIDRWPGWKPMTDHPTFTEYDQMHTHFRTVPK